MNAVVVVFVVFLSHYFFLQVRRLGLSVCLSAFFFPLFSVFPPILSLSFFSVFSLTSPVFLRLSRAPTLLTTCTVNIRSFHFSGTYFHEAMLLF